MRSLLGMGLPFILSVVFFIGETPSFGQETSVFECTVVGPDQQPLSGATVHVLNTAFAATSDKEGHAIIRGLGKGIFLFQCSFAGHADLLQEIDTRTSTRFTFRLFPRTVQLDEVVVTAEKREVALQRLPLSVTSFSSERTKDYRLWNSRDLSALSPNVYSTHSGDERNVTGIRGITTTSYTPAVATYIDGVSQFSLDTYIATLFDVERIEVLRGPQGTLYGRNAMGGVINVITKMPTNEIKANAELNFGNFGLQRHSVSVRFPLVKNHLFMGMAAQMQKRDGFYQNTETGSSYDKQRTLVSNYFIHYKIDRHWSIRLNTKQQQQRNDGPFPLAFGTQQAFDDAYKLGYNALGKMNDRTGNTSLILQYDGPRVLMTAQSAYQRNYRYYENPLDGDFSSLDAISVANNYGKDWNNVKVWTHELRFSNPSGSVSPLQWTAGMYFFRQDNPVKQATLFGKDAGLLGIPDANSSLINISKEKVNGQAFFGQTSYQLGNAFTLIAGLRFDREEKDLSVRGEYEKTGVGNFVIRTDTGASRNFIAFSPKVGIQYQPAKGHQYYVTLSRGYRPGGFTPMNSDPSQPPLYPYDPEYSLNGEAGMKHTWLDGRWVLNFAAFYSVVSDIQVPTLVLPDAITLIRNTGKMVSAGLEMEGSVIPAKGLRMDYAFGLTNARYRSLTVSSNGQSLDLKGKRQLFTPDRTGLLAMQYTLPIKRTSNNAIIARAEWVHTGNIWFDLSNSIRQSAFTVLNARFGWMGKKAEIYCWGRNLSGKKFIAYAYDFGAIHLGDPRTFGITLLGKL